MKKFAYFSDLAFAFTAAFLPTLCLLRYRDIPILSAIFLSVAVGILVCLPISFFFQKNYRRKRLKNHEKEEAEKLLLHLAMLSQEEQANFFLERLQIFTNEPGETRGEAGSFLIETDSCMLFPRFQAAPIGADDAMPLFNLNSTKKPILLCNKLSADANDFLKRFSIERVEGAEIYLRLKSNESLPNEYKSERAFEKKKKQRWAIFIKKENAKRFLTGGGLLLLSSFLSPFPYYYLVTGVALVGVSALVKVFGKEQ